MLPVHLKPVEAAAKIAAVQDSGGGLRLRRLLSALRHGLSFGQRIVHFEQISAVVPSSTVAKLSTVARLRCARQWSPGTFPLATRSCTRLCCARRASMICCLEFARAGQNVLLSPSPLPGLSGTAFGHSSHIGERRAWSHQDVGSIKPPDFGGGREWEGTHSGFGTRFGFA